MNLSTSSPVQVMLAPSECCSKKTLFPRERWSSRSAFIVTAVGAAVGFGTIWRFPALVYQYGGGAFFLPYILALVCIGIPMLVQEIAMGQYLQSNDVAVNAYFHKTFKGVGVASIFSGLIVSMYYVPLISWCIRAFFESFGRMRDDWQSMEGSEANKYFFHDIVGTYTLDEDRKPTRVVGLNVVYLALTWIIVGCSLAFGLKWTGRVAYVTMGLPVFFMFLLLIRALTLPGAGDGIHAYIGEWDLSVLVQQPDIWSTAVAQTFFSVGIAFGVMTAFGSHCERDAPAFENSIVVAVSTSAFSILSGFCLFAILGYLALMQGDFRVRTGPAFLFGAYPAALSTISGGLHWVRLLFLSLIMLGLNSAFALVEGVASLVEDSQFAPSAPSKKMLIAGICIIGFLGGLIYTTDSGLIFVDTIDYYVNFAVLFLGFCKALSAGWIYGMGKQMDKLGYSMVYGYFGATFGGLLFASLVWFGVKESSFWFGLLCFLVIYGCGLVYCWGIMKSLVSEEKGITMMDLFHELTMGNIINLKVELEGTVGYMPWIWAFLMKHLIPQALLVLFFNLFFAKTAYGNMEFGNYNNYEIWPFQVLGVSCALLIFAIVISGMAYSKLFNVFMKTPLDEEKESEWVDVNVEMLEQQEASCDYVNMEPQIESVVVPPLALDANVNSNVSDVADENDVHVLT
ncbi:sodium:neurotransmitter symporter family protein [Nitzschia inconspicua]|uniref:Sodium:neurotransmitter symporter family protein n=1 Tax=Nitzschia inconspicua TaxID=303405 RepID=A0A9K3PTT0_9STRA|nr:sodium:neurotransmitter symporter family protein [Nitzschia inconspicua]